MACIQLTYEKMQMLKGMIDDYLHFEEIGWFSYPIPEDIRAKMMDLADCIARTGADKPQGPVIGIEEKTWEKGRSR